LLLLLLLLLPPPPLAAATFRRQCIRVSGSCHTEQGVQFNRAPAHDSACCCFLDSGKCVLPDTVYYSLLWLLVHSCASPWLCRCQSFPRHISAYATVPRRICATSTLVLEVAILVQTTHVFLLLLALMHV
jgi:hypothetical protein